MMSEQSLGMIETWGYVTAVEALDAGMKAASVISGGFKLTPSALVTVSFTGDVSAVKTAVSAGVAAARKVGKVVAHHVIPRLSTAVNSLNPDKVVTGDQTLKTKSGRKSQTSSFENKGRQSDGTPTSSQKKTAGRKQKKKPSRADKKSGAYGPRHQPMNETDSG
jgi:microcompartment protein CcmL/EutN